MAYLVELLELCVNCHTYKAMVEVFNHRNASQGKFCRKCAEDRINLLNGNE